MQKIFSATDSFFQFSPERFKNPLIIVSLVFAFLGFVFTLASGRLSSRLLKNRVFETDEDKENAEKTLSLIMKVIGLIVVMSFGLTIVFIGSE